MGMAARSPEHVCHLFDSDDTRADRVAAFLADGIQGGDHTIVIVRPFRWMLIAMHLAARGIEVDRQIADGRLVVKDAASTLSQITPRGRLSQFAFNGLLGAAVKGATGTI